MQIQILPAGGENTLFKQFFSDWKAKYDTTGPGKAYTIGSIAVVEQIPFDATALHDNRAMAAQHNMVDDGSGEVQVGPMGTLARVVNGDPNSGPMLSTAYVAVEFPGGYFLPMGCRK